MRYLIGIGNYHGLDDSIGLRIAETVGERGLDAGFRAIDLGGDLLDVIHYLDAETESVLIVDSARMGLAPGDLAFFTPERAVSEKALAGFSTHEGDLIKVLALAAEIGGRMPPVTILGIEPDEIGDGAGLSGALSARFEEYVDAAVGFMAAGSNTTRDEEPGWCAGVACDTLSGGHGRSG